MTSPYFEMHQSAGIRLCRASQNDIELLSSILEDLKDLERKLNTDEPKMITSAQSIISDVLRNNLENSTEEVPDDEDLAWGEEWEPEELYEWCVCVQKRQAGSFF